MAGPSTARKPVRGTRAPILMARPGAAGWLLPHDSRNAAAAGRLRTRAVARRMNSRRDMYRSRNSYCRSIKLSATVPPLYGPNLSDLLLLDGRAPGLLQAVHLVDGLLLTPFDADEAGIVAAEHASHVGFRNRRLVLAGHVVDQRELR